MSAAPDSPSDFGWLGTTWSSANDIVSPGLAHASAPVGPGDGAADLLHHSPFSGTLGALPAGWTSVGSSPGNDYLASGSLSVPGLASSTAHRWAFDNSTHNTYRLPFSPAPVPSGGTVYFSFLLRVDNLASLSTTGGPAPLFFLNTAASSNSQQGVAGIGILRDAADPAAFNLSIDGDSRGPSHADSVKLTGRHATGVTHLVVGSYTLAGAGSISRFWINPATASLGADNAPAPDAQDNAAARAAISAFFVNTLTSTTHVPGAWSIDELRLGATWASVTPVTSSGTDNALRASGNAAALRALDTTAFPATHTIEDGAPGAPATRIGRPGSTVWIRFLVRADAADPDGTLAAALQLRGKASGGTVKLQIGDTGPSPVWSLRSGSITAASTVPIVTGETTCLVARIRFVGGSANDRVDLFVNPPAGPTPPADAVADATLTGVDIGPFGEIGIQANRTATFDEISVALDWGDL